MNDLYFHLKEQFVPFKNIEVIKKFTTGKHILYNAKDLLGEISPSPTLQSFETDIFKITQIELLVIPAGGKMSIQTDSVSPSGSIKMNFSYGDSNARMEWFKFKYGIATITNQWDDSMQNDSMITGEIRTEYNQNDCELIHSEFIKQPSLVNVSIPHRINCENSDVKCMVISVMFKQYLNDDWTKIKMSEALKLWGNR